MVSTDEFRELSFFGLKTRPDLIRANRDGRARLAGFYFPRIRGATSTI